MAALNQIPLTSGDNTFDETLFALIGDDIEKQGYSIRPNSLPADIADSLFAYQINLNSNKYEEAGIGRGDDYIKTEFVRTDEICWITGASSEGLRWLDWASRLKTYLNRRFFLGLFSFESHFAHYSSGDYYKRHYDAFKGETNRILSVVAYLNPGWTTSDAGELVLYTDDVDKEGIKVLPTYGTLAIFLSEEFPHEVLPANRDRYSVAGWFRVNTSSESRVDPPQ